MSIYDIVDKETLNKLLIDDNFELLSKLYLEKKREEKFTLIKDKIKNDFDEKYKIQEINIGKDILTNISYNINKDHKSSCTWLLKEDENVRFYKYIIRENLEKKIGFDRFELIILDHKEDEMVGIFMTSYFNDNPKIICASSSNKNFDTIKESNFLWDSFFNSSTRQLNRIIEDIYEEFSPDFSEYELMFLEPIKLLHLSLKDVDKFYYKDDFF